MSWTLLWLVTTQSTFLKFSCVHGFSEFHSDKPLPKLIWLVLLDEISLISSSLICRSILCLGKGTNNWLKHRIDLKQQHHRDITPCSFYVSMWTGSLFGERVQKSQEEGREKVRACRQTFGTIVPRHPLCIRSSCKLLLARTLTVDTFDLHRFLVSRYLI